METLQGSGWLPSMLSGNSSSRSWHFYLIYCKTHIVLLYNRTEKLRFQYATNKKKALDEQDRNHRKFRGPYHFMNQQDESNKKKTLLQWCGCCPCLAFMKSPLCISLPFFFLSHTFHQFLSTSHCISSHLLGLCKYCHCEILWALIDADGG